MKPLPKRTGERKEIKNLSPANPNHSEKTEYENGIISLADREKNLKSKIESLDEENIEPVILQDLWDQGFLPGAEITVLERYLSQKKIVVLLGDAITVALPLGLADNIHISPLKSSNVPPERIVS